MSIYKLTLEYDGTNFCGWQRQESQPSVQSAVEAAVVKYCGAKVTAHSAGRTDAGVHARAMVAHIDLAHAPEPQVVQGALNFHLKPAAVAVINVEQKPDDFHARFSCKQRAYQYRILARRARPTLDYNRVWHVPAQVDADAMDVAAKALIGQHDFTTFRASMCQAQSPEKSLNTIRVRRSGDEILIDCAARSFLHNQVRSMVGSLLEVGLGRWPTRKIAEVLAAKDRTQCGQVAPASGLYFMRADYDE